MFPWLREGILTLSLVHIEFYVKTLHFGTVSVCLAKYKVYRIIGSGATVQSVSRCFLVVKTAIPFFHDGMKKL